MCTTLRTGTTRIRSNVISILSGNRSNIQWQHSSFRSSRNNQLQNPLRPLHLWPNRSTPFSDQINNNCRMEDQQIRHLNTSSGKRVIETSSSQPHCKKAALSTNMSTNSNNIDSVVITEVGSEDNQSSTQEQEQEKADSTSEKVKPLVIIIAGCTGVGKSDTAFKLCDPSISGKILSSHYQNNSQETPFPPDKQENLHHTKGHIISADSVQVFQGVAIGANKPSREELAKYTHHLVDVVSPTGQYSAASWREDAIKAISSITNEYDRGKDKAISNQRSEILPIVVGGTMMYLQWLVHGRPDAVKPTPEALEKAEQFVQKYQSMSQKHSSEKSDDNLTSDENVDEGWQMAMEETSKLGPIFKARVEKLPGKDWYRLRRTLEVAFSVLDTNAPLTPEEEQKQQQKLQSVFTGERVDALSDLGYDVRCFFLCPNDRMHHTTIVDERCEQMLLRGLLKETADLSLSGNLPSDGLPAKAIGYRQTLDYLNRKDPKPEDTKAFDEFLNGFTAATRQYSKKQMSWFRRDDKFMFIPVSLVNHDKDGIDKASTMSKEERVNEVVKIISSMSCLSREKFDYELTNSDPNHMSVKARKMNEDQAKGMKVYQGKRYYLVEGNTNFEKVMSEADECTSRMQRMDNFTS